MGYDPSWMTRPERPLTVLELFSGIGGAAAALGEAARVVEAIDIDRVALAVYAANLPHPTAVRNLCGLEPAACPAMAADLWWLSPPCQPFTRRGRRRDDADPRAAALLHLIGQLERVLPRYLALENVPGFEGSRTHGRLRDTLEAAGYRVAEHLLCPSELGLPNRRRRFYLVASRDAPLAPLPRPDPAERRLAAYLDPEPDLAVAPELLSRYRHAVDVVRADDPDAVTACFTAAYGRSPVRSGSFLDPGEGRPVRYLSPSEILRLLGFPESFRLPAALPRARAWRLVGNSLSLPPVRTVLAQIPDLAPRLPNPAQPARSAGAG